MRIIAIDLAGVCRRFFELDRGGSLSEGSALTASINYITRASEGFDRVVIARDVRPSFRKQICSTYKANREDPGPVYEKLEKDVAVRAWKDGATIFPATSEEAQIKIGDGYPEADDVLASLATWFVELTDFHYDSELVLLSQDGDICSLVSDEFKVMVRRFDGEIWTEKEVFEKLGYGPGLVVHVKALAGDASDRYKPFPHYDAKPEDETTKPGIGEKKAVGLLEKWGAYGDPSLGLSMGERVLLAAQDGASWDSAPPATRPIGNDAMSECHERKCLVAGGATALKMGYACAAMLNALQLDFSRILKEPVKRPLTAPKEPVQTAETTRADDPPAAPAQMVVRPAESIRRPRRNRNEIERYALQPRSFEQLEAASKLLLDARLFPQFASWQSIAGAMWIGAELGLGAGQALRGTYVVHGKHAHSAALMAALVKREKSCIVFRLLGEECDDKKAVVEYHRDDMPRPQRYTFTIEMAKRMGVIKRDSKWETQPHLMLCWAAIRECARLYWFELVAGMYTPDELRNGGGIEDAEFEQTKADFEDSKNELDANA